MNSMALLVQVIVDLFFVVAIVVLWIQFRRPKNEDPRLASGLQELQSKIAVLEDLGDRTEKQVQQLMIILENKLIDVQKKIEQANKVQGNISKSMEKSLEVVKIFQDKIPHEEIHERQNTVKFVKAALLANQGYTIQEVSEQVDLPYGELEFIAKVNKNELSFDEKQLPEWIRAELNETKFAIKDNVQFLESPLCQQQQLKTNAGMTSANQDELQALGEKFRKAQILVSQRRVVEPQQKVFEEPIEDLGKESEVLFQPQVQQQSQSQVQAQQQSQSQVQPQPQIYTQQQPHQPQQHSQSQQVLSPQEIPLSQVPLPAQAQSSPLVKALGSHHQVAATVQRLIDKKKKELVAQQSTNLFKHEPSSLMQESKILKKGKELGIRPVVFPRIEVDRKR